MLKKIYEFSDDFDVPIIITEPEVIAIYQQILVEQYEDSFVRDKILPSIPSEFEKDLPPVDLN